MYGGCNMEKDRFVQDDLQQVLNRKNVTEELEISSTGYGFESVSVETGQQNESQAKKMLDSFSEGY